MKLVGDQVAQFVDVQLRRVDDVIRKSADGAKLIALDFNAFGDRKIGTQWMRTPGLAEAAHQRGVIRLQKYQAGPDIALNPPEDRRKTLQRFTFANVDDQRRPLIIDPCRPHRVTLVPQTADRLTAGGKAASAQRKGKPRDLSQALIT